MKSKTIIKLEKKIPNITGIEKIDKLNELAFEYHKSDPTITRKYANEALLLARKFGHNEGIALSFNYIGISHHLTSEFDLALSNYKKSLRIFKKYEKNTFIARLYSNIGGIYEKKGEFNKAIKYQFQSIELLEKIGEKLGLASSFNNLAINYQKINKYELALSYYLKSYDIKKDIGDKTLFSTSYNNLGAIYEKLGKEDLALKYYLKSIKLKEKYHPNNKDEIAVTFSNLGFVCKGKKDYTSALNYYKKALNLFQDIKNKYGIVNTKNNLARLYLDLKDFQSTEIYLDKSLTIAKKIGAKELEMQVYQILNQLFEEQKKFEEALINFKKYKNIENQLFNEKQVKIIADVREKYETKKKEEETKILKLKNTELDKLNKKLHVEISERKKAEEKIREYAVSKELLLQEVNHRVKNNLYTINGLLFKEKEKLIRVSKKSDNIKFLDDITYRVDSLSSVHSLLSASEWKPLSISKIFYDIAKQYFIKSQPDIIHNVGKNKAKEMADSFQAHHLAMVYNEILTNSSKHYKASLKELKISTTITSDSKKIYITIKDNGVGFPQKIIDGDYSNTGIGFDLIFGIVEQSLGGSVKLYNDNGAGVVLTIKKIIKNDK